MTASMTKVVPARIGWIRNWPHWAPYAAMVWSLMYAGLGFYWVAGGSGFPYTPVLAADLLGPLAGRLGPVIAWIIVMVEGLPAVAIGALMLRGVGNKLVRPLLITSGILLTGILLLLMTSLNLLVKVGYIPAVVIGLFSAEKGQAYLAAWVEWETTHQLLCLIGGFLWLVATISYTRRNDNACPYCGRRDSPESWTNPARAAHWGRIAVYVAMIAPICYAITRFAWALGIPLGMSTEALKLGQENGTWISGLSLASFGLLGAALMLGLVQRWGEIFPRWMIGLAGHRVPILLAVVPASLASVLLVVGGVGIWVGLPQLVSNARAIGAQGSALLGEIIFQVGPTLLFPVWGVGLAVAALGYYYRRRGPCGICGRGLSGKASEPAISQN